MNRGGVVNPSTPRHKRQGWPFGLSSSTEPVESLRVERLAGLSDRGLSPHAADRGGIWGRLNPTLKERTFGSCRSLHAVEWVNVRFPLTFSMADVMNLLVFFL